MKADELQKHIFFTYLSLRYGMALLALAFPIILYLLGSFQDMPLQDSMSHYYFATPCESLVNACNETGLVLFPVENWTEPAFPMRAWFVGLLFAIGAFLFLYSGFTSRENWLLNFAGIFAWGVALFPMDRNPAGNWWDFSAHGVSAVALFACMALVVWLCAHATLKYVEDPKTRKRFHMKYHFIAVLMALFPVIALIVSKTIAPGKHIFFIEAGGVWVFAFYWWVKSRELSQSGADKRALQAEIELSGAE